jgi:hypothetical protein
MLTKPAFAHGYELLFRGKRIWLSGVLHDQADVDDFITTLSLLRPMMAPAPLPERTEPQSGHRDAALVLVAQPEGSSP